MDCCCGSCNDIACECCGYGVGCYEWWYYLTMPIMAGVVGWMTNVLALQMTFYPIEFFGVELFRLKNQPWGFFGWQGIIPTKVEKIATATVDHMTTKLMNLHEVFDNLDPIDFCRSVEGGSLLMLDQIINEVANKYLNSTWNGLPQRVRDEIVLLAFEESPDFLTHLMRDMQNNIYDIFDLKHMSVQACVENKAVLNLIFKEAGEKELIFIKRSGLYFGFLFGLVQMTVWYFYNENWILPVCGFVVGWLTNFLALKCIFAPLEPTKFLGITFHGIFFRRQKEVAATYARILCVEVLTMKAMWNGIFTGPKSANFNAMLRAHTIAFTEQFVQGIRPLVIVALGTEQFSQMKEDVASKVIKKLPNIIDESYLYMTEAMALEETIKTKMEDLTFAEFESVLHPAFEEDEILLIMIGGVLGMVVGIIQIFMFQSSES